MMTEPGIPESQRRQIYFGNTVQFLVLSRRLAATRTLGVPYVVISIVDSHESFPDAEIALSPLRRGVLRLRFDDVDAECTGAEYQPFSQAMATQIIRFVAPYAQRGVSGVIVHCAQGISRSSAVAACLSQWLNSEATDFFDEFFSPNPTVRTILSRTIAIMEPEVFREENSHNTLHQP